MRTRLFACLLISTFAACGTPGGATDGGDDAPPVDAAVIDPPARGFQLVSPDIEILPNQEITYCWYFKTPNTEPMAIKKWASEMTPGSHHLILFTTTSERRPAGTVEANCGIGASTASIPSWTYSAQTSVAQMELPPDDGAGKPLGMDIPAGTFGYIQMHYFNASDQPIMAHVTVNAEALPADAAYTRTAAYVTYNNQISIPPGATADVESQQCTVPSGAKFWLMSTHAHKQAVKTEVLDGTRMAFESFDWEHPGAAKWMATPFFTFQTNKVTYRCTYQNPTNRTITSGDSALTDEMCMASGYYFPATKPLLCVDGFGPI